MIFARSGDCGDRDIAYVVEGIRFTSEVVMKELGSDMVGLGWVIGDVTSLES
jgi:hypothetical protein